MAGRLEVQKHRLKRRAIPARRKISSIHTERYIRGLGGKSIRLDVREPTVAWRRHSK
jgi:hypothetical protein